MLTTITLALSGALNGAVFDVAARGRLSSRGIDLALPGRQCGVPGNGELLVLAAVVPALALGAVLFGLVRGVPLVARTRLDVLGDHSREVGTVVVAGTTSRSQGRLVCTAEIGSAGVALKIGERLLLPGEVQLAVTDGPVLHASTPSARPAAPTTWPT